MGENNPSQDGVRVFVPEWKKIDVLSSEAFQASLQSYLAPGARLVVDLSKVQFVDSSGLGKILAAVRSFREQGGDLRLCGVQPPVLILFNMVRLGDLVGIDPDAGAAGRAILATFEPGGAR